MKVVMVFFVVVVFFFFFFFGGEKIASVENPGQWKVSSFTSRSEKSFLCLSYWQEFWDFWFLPFQFIQHNFFPIVFPSRIVTQSFTNSLMNFVCPIMTRKIDWMLNISSNYNLSPVEGMQWRPIHGGIILLTWDFCGELSALPAPGWSACKWCRPQTLLGCKAVCTVLQCKCFRPKAVQRSRWSTSWSGCQWSHSQWCGCQCCIVWLLRKQPNTRPSATSVRTSPLWVSGQCWLKSGG